MAKRKRATKAEMQQRKAAILKFAEDQQPVTVRGIFYRLTTLGLVPKTQKGYEQAAKTCLNMRLDGEMPFELIADNTRWMRKPTSYASVDQFFEYAGQAYRRDLMISEGLDIEIWLEKDTLTGIFYPVTQKYDVPLMVSGGFSSVTFLHTAASELTDGAFIYVFTDYDSAGDIIKHNIEKRLREFSDKKFHIERVMLSKEQVIEWDLPTRDPKARDKQKGYEFCAELDAVPPTILRQEVERCIAQHIPQGKLEQLRKIEASERQAIMSYAENYQLDSFGISP